MFEVEFSAHAREMLLERRIPEEWVWRVIQTYDKKYMGEDGNLHYTKTIRERDGRGLHVVINPVYQPNRIVTLFFDRRIGKRT